MKVIFDSDSGWAIAAFCCFAGFVVLICIVEVVTMVEYYDTLKPFSRSFNIGWSITLVVLYVVANAIVATTSAVSQSPPGATEDEIAASFGLTSGRTYPLILGDRSGGATGSVQGNLFYVSGTTAPASSVAIGFQHNDDSWILDLPTSNITFHEQKDVSPSVTIYLSGKGVPEVGDAYTPQAWYVDRYGTCNWTFHDLWFVCEKPVLSSKLEVRSDIKQTGLSKVVQGDFKFADITLTPAMYKALVKGN